MILLVMNIKNQLRQLLKNKGLTAAELSRQAGVSRQVISDWLGGTTPKNLQHLKKVADVFNITIDELCFSGAVEKKGSVTQNVTIDSLLGDEWIGGLFEVRLRKVKR